MFFGVLAFLVVNLLCYVLLSLFVLCGCRNFLKTVAHGESQGQVKKVNTLVVRYLVISSVFCSFDQVMGIRANIWGV